MADGPIHSSGVPLERRQGVVRAHGPVLAAERAAQVLVLSAAGRSSIICPSMMRWSWSVMAGIVGWDVPTAHRSIG
jgi:hypothetical protein